MKLMFYSVMFAGNSKIHPYYGEDTNYYKSINQGHFLFFSFQQGKRPNGQYCCGDYPKDN